MEDLPRNAAGKPLRIKLATRLGLGCLNDHVPALHRHFEANTPGSDAALSDPIPCSRVSVDVNDVEGALLAIIGVEDVAIRFRTDGIPEAFVSTQRESGLDSSRLRKTISRILPGYGVPELYAVEKPFSRGEKGQIDFAAIEDIIKAQNSSSMSEQALLVRDIVANLLLTDPGMITADSDFFLLGGNSLLLGKLSYFIKKQMGANIAVADIFTNSTIQGIASLIASEVGVKPAAKDYGGEVMEKFREDDANDSNSTLGYDYDVEDPMERSRGQTHLLSLIVQAIPIVFFYPLKAAWTCGYFYPLHIPQLTVLFRVDFTVGTFHYSTSHQRRFLGASSLPSLCHCSSSIVLSYNLPSGRYSLQMDRNWSLSHWAIPHVRSNLIRKLIPLIILVKVVHISSSLVDRQPSPEIWRPWYFRLTSFTRETLLPHARRPYRQERPY